MDTKNIIWSAYIIQVCKQQNNGDYYVRTLTFELVGDSNISENVFSSLELAMRDAYKKNSIKTGLVSLCSEEYYASINHVIFYCSICSLFICLMYNYSFSFPLGRKVCGVCGTKISTG